MNRRFTHIVEACVAALLVSLGGLADAQIIHVVEAEKCTIQCKAGNQPAGNMWANLRAQTPPYWGREPGDLVAFAFNAKQPLTDAKLAVRYAYDKNTYAGEAGPVVTTRTLYLAVDQKTVIPFMTEDTTSWDRYVTADVPLPSLAAGPHTFSIFSNAQHTVTNLDCFTIYRGPPETLPPAFRRTEYARSPSGHFVIRSTAGAGCPMYPEQIFSEFERIYAHYKDSMGWEPPNPVVIHIIEDSKWDNPGATAYQNQWGVFFRESTFAPDKGNWVHEMTHMFYCAHFPGWFDESSVQCLTMFNWYPDLFPQQAKLMADPTYKGWYDDAADFARNPARTTDNILVVQNAVRIKYGHDVFKKFFHLCKEAADRKELDFVPGHHLSRDNIMKYMSQAAGENVALLYGRWTGFSGQK